LSQTNANIVPTLRFFLVLILYNTIKKYKTMRIDKFLNSVNITKRRSVAQDMINNKVICINDKVVKASKNVEVGNIVSINYLNEVKKYKVLKIPTTKSTPKSLQAEYIKDVL